MNPNEARSFAGERVGRVRKRGWFGEMFKTKDLDKECDLKSTEDCDYEEVLEYMNKPIIKMVAMVSTLPTQL